MKYYYLALALFCIQCSDPKPQQLNTEITQHKKVIHSIKIADVWAGHPVGFDILTDDSYQYVAFYDSARNMCIAQRQVDSENWKFTILPSRVGWDSHNRIAIALDGEGFLHVSGNMHAVPLVYFRSNQPYDISTFDAPAMIGTEEERVTYPVFFKNQEGELFFQYRDGGSGNGITYINRYNIQTNTWARVLDQGLFDGEGETNAYPTSPQLGADGYFHYMWVWRLNPIANTNHNLSYVKTKDFQHFENINGESISIPIRYRERRVIADPVGPWNGLMNSSKLLAFDSQGKAVFGYHKFDKHGDSQLFLCHFRDGNWINKQITDWSDFSWEINKTGSLGRDIGLHAIKADGTGYLYVAYSHVKYGSGLLKVHEESLELVENMAGKKLTGIAGLQKKSFRICRLIGRQITQANTSCSGRRFPSILIAHISRLIRSLLNWCCMKQIEFF